MLLIVLKKFLGRRQSEPSTRLDSASPEEMAIRIQDGDHELRNQMLTDYQPYIAKVTSRFCKRYIDPAQDDEFSVALSAFNEALDKYSAESGASFLGFSETVIRRRLIDWVRKEQRHASQIPYSSFEVKDDEDHVMNPVDIRRSIEQYEEQRSVDERRLEIEELNEQLFDYGITFMDLVDASPKHADSRILIMSIARTLAETPALMQALESKKVLPIKDLLEKVEVSRKTLERNRKYIIAVVLIMAGHYSHLQEYLSLPIMETAGKE